MAPVFRRGRVPAVKQIAGSQEAFSPGRPRFGGSKEGQLFCFGKLYLAGVSPNPLNADTHSQVLDPIVTSFRSLGG